MSSLADTDKRLLTAPASRPLRFLVSEGEPREQYERTYVLVPPTADTAFMRRLLRLLPVGERWTIGGSADDAGIGRLDVRRVIALRPQDWSPAGQPEDLAGFFAQFYPGVQYWPLDWENDYQLAGRLLAYSLKETGLTLPCPTTHPTQQMVEPFGNWRPQSATHHCGLDLLASWAVWGDEVLSVTEGVVVEAGAGSSQGGLGYRVRVQTTVSDGRQVLIRYGHLSGPAGIYVTVGQRVTVGQKLGRPGDTGLRETDHLHLDVKVGDSFADPALLLQWPREVAVLPARSGRADAPDKVVLLNDAVLGATGAAAPAVPSTDVAEEETPSVSPTDGVEENVDGPTVVLLPCFEDLVERMEWRTAAAIGSVDLQAVVAHPSDSSRFRLQGCRVVAVNPAKWEEGLESWLQRHAPAAPCRVVETESPWEMAVLLAPELNGDIAMAQSDRRWAHYDFGEDPDAGDETIGRYGCFMTGFAIILRKVYGRDITPPLLDKLLVAARAAYVDDNIMAWEGAVPLFPVFDDAIKDNRSRSARELRRLLQDGWEVILRRADGGHFVYLEAVEGDKLRIIDTWDGVRKTKSPADFAGIRAAHLKSHPAPAQVMVGLHDWRGAEWMVAHGVTGCCLVHYPVQRQAIQIDCRSLQEAGLTVICRLNWGYAGAGGTLPRREERNSFIAAVVSTMLSARGVDYFHIGNEPNNRQEWPGFGTHQETPLTPDDVVAIYNEIWRRVAGRARMGPPPVDPYFGPNSDCRQWWVAMLEGISGADALFFHAKTQTNDPAEVWSRQRFSDPPLTWQYLHLRAIEPLLAAVPERFRSLPTFVTELNPQCLTTIGGATGWRADNAAWVHEALRYFREERPVTGVIFYRYELAGDQAPFGLENKPAILQAIAEESAQA